MKKICFITTISLTLKTFVLKTAEYIHENTDWDISFICSPDDVFAASLPEYIHFYPVTMERGISLTGVKAMWEMLVIFRREKFDMIQFSTPNASLYAVLAGFFTRIPVRLYCQWGMAFVGFTGMKRRIFRAEERLVCKLSTHVEPDSYSNLNYAHDERLYPKSKGGVVWNGSACGVDLEKFDISKKKRYRKEIRGKLNIPSESFVYGFVGRVTRDKGMNELLEAFQTLGNDGYLLIVGPSEIDDTINGRLYNWSVESNRVIYTGYTNVVEQYLAAMDCYILPSYREGFGMGVVEAEAMGVPVIVTNIPGPVDAVQNGTTGLIVDKASVNELRKAMDKMYSDEELRNRMSHCSEIFAKERFEQQNFLKRLLEDRKEIMAE